MLGLRESSAYPDSVKQIPKGRFYELYQDHICSSVLRVAREVFAILPPVRVVFVHAACDLINTQTGYKDEQTILSVAIPRESLMDLNFEAVDCSDSMANFVHNMNFRKTKGFAPCEQLQPEDFEEGASAAKLG